MAEDLAHVAAIARALDGRASIRVDVNQAWSLTDARRGLAGLQDIGCELAEQPIRTGDLAARIARLTGHEPPPEPAAMAGADNRVSAPPSKELRALGWRPRVSLQQGLRQVIAWERARASTANRRERRSA